MTVVADGADVQRQEIAEIEQAVTAIRAEFGLSLHDIAAHIGTYAPSQASDAALPAVVDRKPYWLRPTGALIEHARATVREDIGKGWLDRAYTEQVLNDCALDAAIAYLMDKYDNLLRNYEAVYRATAEKVLTTA